MKIRINNAKLSSEDIEELVNRILWYAEKCVKSYEANALFGHGYAHAYSEILATVCQWNTAANAQLNKDLEKWAADHLPQHTTAADKIVRP